MHFDARRGNVFHYMIFKQACVIQGPAAFRAGFQTQVVLNGVRAGRHGGTHGTWMFPMCFAALVWPFRRPLRRVALGTKSLLSPLQLQMQFRNLRLQFDNPRVALSQTGFQRRNPGKQLVDLASQIIHDSHNVASELVFDNTSLLNSYN